MYASRTRYTLADLPTIPQARMVGCVVLDALASLLYAASGLLAGLSWRVEAAAYRACPLPEPILLEEPTEVLPAFRSFAWEGDRFLDDDTEVQLHLDPTVVSPALSDRPVLTTLADCRAAFCEAAPVAEPISAPVNTSPMPAAAQVTRKPRKVLPAANPSPLATITYTVYQRVQGRRAWEPVGTFEEIDSDPNRKEGLRTYLIRQGVEPTAATMRKYSARKPEKVAS